MDHWSITVTARRSLLATFEHLDADQWAVPSLCGEWTIRQLLAHLVLAARPPARRYVVAVARARGNFDRANHALAVVDGRRPVDDLTTNYRAVLDHRFAPPGWPTAAPLSDILLHTLDVRIPLGIDTVEPPEHYEPVIDLLAGRFGGSFTRPDRPDVRWVATDHDWSSGKGPEVRGTMADLALTAAGRAARLDELRGDGAVAVRVWLS